MTQNLSDQSLIEWASSWVANEQDRERFTNAFGEELSRRRSEQIKARVESVDVRHGKVVVWINTNHEGMQRIAKRLVEAPDYDVLLTAAMPSGGVSR